MYKYGTILLLFLCCACSRGKYFITNNPPPNARSILIDTSYQFYIRQVYIDKDENSNNVLRANVSNADTAHKQRIEVEYLLVSWLHKNIIYISTVPDKFQYYYSKYILPDTIINAYDFNVFQFGKLNEDGEMITFISENGEKKISWQMKPALNGSLSKQIFLRELSVEKKNVLTDVILVDKTLQDPMVFTKQPYYIIVFSKPPDIINADSLTRCRLLDNRIYFDKYKDGYNIYFKFTKNINSTDSTIGFNFKRAHFNPLPLSASSQTDK